MTKELQAIQRQILERSASLPNVTSYSGVAGLFGAAAKQTGLAATQLSSEFAAQQGLMDAIDNKPTKLAPGLTAATRAYNNAYLNTQSSIVSLNAARLLDDKLLEMSAPGRLNSNSIAQYNEVAKGIIQGTLEGSEPEIKASVGLRLTEHLYRNQSRLAGKVQDYNSAQIDNAFNYAFSEEMKNLKESALAGSAEEARVSYENIKSLISDRKSLGLLSPEQEATILEKVSDTFLISDYTSKYLNARASGNEEKFLLGFSENKPKDLSFDSWVKIGSELLKLKTQQDKLVDSAQSLSYARWQQKIDSGDIQNLSDLDPAQDQMTALDFTKLQNSFMRSREADFKKQIKVQEFYKNSAINPIKAEQASDDIKNTAFNNLVEAQTELKRANTNNPNATLSLLEQAKIAGNLSVPVPEFNAKLNYAFLTEMEDVSRGVEALAAYKYLAGDPAKLQRMNSLALDKKAEQVASSALFMTERGGLTPDMAIMRAKETVLKASDVTRQARLDTFNQTFGGIKGDKKLRTQFKSDIGFDSTNNPEIFKTYETQLRVNAQAMGTLDEAVEFTKRQFVNTVGASKYGPNAGMAMFHPPEKTVAFADTGYWLENQYALALNRISKNWEAKAELEPKLPQMEERLSKVTNELAMLSKDPKANSVRINELSAEGMELSKNIRIARFKGEKVTYVGPKLPDAIKERDLLDKQLSSKEISIPLAGKSPVYEKPMLMIKGKAREVFIMSDASTMSRDNGKVTYGLYYKDDYGFSQPIEEPFSEYGVAEWAVTPFDEFLPEVSTELSDKTISEVSSKEANALFERDNPKRMIIDNLFPFAAAARESQRREFVKEKQPEIEQRIKAKRRGSND